MIDFVLALPMLIVATVLAFVVEPATADYGICMEYCLEQHDFDHCHPTCSDTFSPSGDTGTAPQLREICKLAEDEQLEQILIWLHENYGPSSVLSIPCDDDPILWEVDFSPYNSDTCCKGTIKLTGECGPRLSPVRRSPA